MRPFAGAGRSNQHQQPTHHQQQQQQHGSCSVLGWLGAQNAEVVHVLVEGNPQRWRVVVGHVVLLAQALHNGLQVAQVAVVDTREEVVLNLEVEAARKQKRQVAVLANRVACEHLSRRQQRTPRKRRSSKAKCTQRRA